MIRCRSARPVPDPERHPGPGGGGETGERLMHGGEYAVLREQVFTGLGTSQPEVLGDKFASIIFIFLFYDR